MARPRSSNPCISLLCLLAPSVHTGLTEAVVVVMVRLAMRAGDAMVLRRARGQRQILRASDAAAALDDIGRLGAIEGRLASRVASGLERRLRAKRVSHLASRVANSLTRTEELPTALVNAPGSRKDFKRCR